MKISYRLARWDVNSSDLQESLVPIIKNNPECFDEIAVFCDLNEHAYESIESIKNNAEVIFKKIQEIKNAGVKSVGINVLNTIGQGDDAWSWLESSPFQTMVGHDGGTCHGSICMRAEGFYKYMCKKYEIYANTGADFIWVDDDLRMAWHTVKFPCFCHTCISEFNKLCGTKYTREALVKALDDDTDGELRYKWMKFNADEMCRLLSGCAESAYKVNENIKLGLMTVGIDLELYNMFNLDEMMDALKATMIRPGGGFWTADDPMQLFRKGRNIAEQIYCAKTGTDIQYESENIPHLESKPQKIHLLEITTALMSGCNGVAIDQVTVNEEKYFKKFIGFTKENRSMWEWLTEKTKNTDLCGGGVVYEKDALSKDKVNPFFDSPLYDAIETEHAFFDAGFCFTQNPENTEYFVLFSHMVDSLSDEKLKEILSKSVVIDDLALKKLVDRGLGSYCGAKSINTYTDGIKEVYMPHRFNTAPENMIRGGKQAQFRGGKKLYIPYELDAKAEPLCVCKSILNDYCGIGSYIYENELGGRVAGLCYAPTELYEQEERVDLLRNVVSWLCHDKPVINISGAYHIMPLVRKNISDDAFCMMLTNTWLDDSDEISVKIKTNYTGKLIAYNSETKEYSEISAGFENGICSFNLPKIKAWDFVIVASADEV